MNLDKHNIIDHDDALGKLTLLSDGAGYDYKVREADDFEYTQYSL